MHSTQIHQSIKHKCDDLIEGSILQFPSTQSNGKIKTSDMSSREIEMASS